MADPFAPNVDDVDLDKEENLVAVREYGKRADRRARKLERENEELAERLKALETKDQVSAAEQSAKAKGLSDEQWNQLLELKPEPTAEDVEKFAKVVGASPATPGTEPKEPVTDPAAPAASEPAAPANPGFTPAPGSTIPAEGVKWDEIKTAIARGDDAFLSRTVKEAVASGKQVDLGPYSHLIGADSNDE